MRRSLCGRLMQSYMGLVAVIIIGISVGLSYLISEFFYWQKSTDLQLRGQEIVRVVTYNLDKGATPASLIPYLGSVGEMLGASIWLFDTNYELLATSEAKYDYREVTKPVVTVGTGTQVNLPSTQSTPIGVRGKVQATGEEKSARDKLSSLGVNASYSKDVAYIARQIKDEHIAGQLNEILRNVYGEHIVNSHILHPYYREQTLLVGLPVKTTSEGKALVGAILISAPVSGLDKVLKEMYLYTLAVGVLALVIGMVIVWSLSKRVVKPLIAMKNSAAAMAAGNYTRKVVIDGEDEIADLGRSLNSLANDISAFIIETQKMEKLRRDFVANVSHELRTPITIIRGYNEALTDGIVTKPEDIAKYHGLINNETLRLEKLINELLEMSRLQRMQQAELTPVPLGNIVQTVADLLSVRAQEHKIKLALTIDKSITIKGDGDRLVQMVMILGDNALKFSPDNSTVSFSLQKNNADEAVLTISDQGAGIATADIPYIWERFYKGDKSHSRKTQGLGLGLSLAREIIRIHKASVNVRSKIGQGTSFEIVFPKEFA